MKSALADVDCIFYLDANCICHQYHLIVKDNLLLLDDCLRQLKATHPHITNGFEAYTASLAKCTNFWRTHVADMIDSWEAIHGFGKTSPQTDPEPIKHRRYPLSVISGRWGSVDNCESFFIERSRKLLAPVFTAVLSKYMKAAKPNKRKPPPAGQAANPPAASDLLGNEDEMQAYKIKMTKWAEGALCTVRSDVFWLVLHVAHKVRSPLQHFFYFCQANSDKRLLQQLVVGKAAEFSREFEELIASFDDWFGQAVKQASCEGLPEDVMTVLRTLSFKMAVHAAGSFHMRIGAHMQTLLCLRLLCVSESGLHVGIFATLSNEFKFDVACVQHVNTSQKVSRTSCDVRCNM